jgi:hypothetical protein
LWQKNPNIEIRNPKQIRMTENTNPAEPRDKTCYWMTAVFEPIICQSAIRQKYDGLASGEPADNIVLRI